MNSANERYHRQVILPGIGITGQEKIQRAKVLIVGVGGLGCPVLLYLASAGVGTLGIADPDMVNMTNLHRQVLFGDADIGSPKTQVAKAKLAAINPGVVINTYPVMLTNRNVLDIIAPYQIVVDCSDNFPTRYLLSDATVLLGKTLVYGAISQFEGQLAVFNYQQNAAPATNYRDLFPIPPSEGEVKNCAEAGVLNVLAGTIGTMMATEALKIITGIGKPLVNNLLTINILSNLQYQVNILPHKTGRESLPNTTEELLAKNYNLPSGESPEGSIDKTKLLELLKSGDTMLADVRESWELPVIEKYDTVNIPLTVIHDHLTQFSKSNIILFCQSGSRSAIAARILRERLGAEKNIWNLQNGVSDLL